GLLLVRRDGAGIAHSHGGGGGARRRGARVVHPPGRGGRGGRGRGGRRGEEGGMADAQGNDADHGGGVRLRGGDGGIPLDQRQGTRMGSVRLDSPPGPDTTPTRNKRWRLV